MIGGHHCISTQMSGHLLSVQGQTHGPPHPRIAKCNRSRFTVQHHPEIVGFEKRNVLKVEVRFESRLQLPLFVEQGLHVGRMQPTDEIMASLSQPQKTQPHVLNHVHVHRIQIRQLTTCGIPFPMPLISVENQSSIRNPPSEHEKDPTLPGCCASCALPFGPWASMMLPYAVVNNPKNGG